MICHVIDHCDPEGRTVLIEQVEYAAVTGCCDCGCPTVYLSVDQDAVEVSSAPSPLPCSTTVVSADGTPIGGVLVFLSDGFLSCLEVYAYDDPIMRMPRVSRLQSQATGRW